MASPEVMEELASIGGDRTVNSPDEFAAMIKSEVGRWHKLASDTKLELD
jgi:tripartite-type tricarboxylate transporter receptor subunit TctC